MKTECAIHVNLVVIRIENEMLDLEIKENECRN